MKLEITNQTNEKECGICVLTSLHNYFYKEKYSKEQILDLGNIFDNGMTLFDFEVIAKKIGIECESYDANWSDFVSLKINNFFVTIIKTIDGYSNHYVICQKKHKKIEIYDSCCSKAKSLSYDQFKKIYINVLIFVHKKPCKAFNKFFGNVQTLLLFDLKFILFNLFLSSLIILLSILSASFLSWIVDLSILKSSVKNLITQSFIFVFIYFLNNIFDYILHLYNSNQRKIYYLLFTNKILDSLENKKNLFFNKVDKNWVYKIDECIYSLSNFFVYEINKFITNLIIVVVCTIIVGIIQIYLIIFAIIFIIIEFIPFLFSFRKKKDLFMKTIRYENKNIFLYKNLIQKIDTEIWINKRKNLINQIKKNYSSLYKNFNDAIVFKANNTLVKAILKSFFDIILISTIAYLIILKNNPSIGKLTFIISAFNLYKNSLIDIFEYFLTKIEFNVYWQVYKDLTIVSNVKTQKIFFNANIKNIFFNCGDQQFNIDTLCVNKIPHSFNEILNKTKFIQINSKKIYIDSKWLLDNMIVINQNINFDKYFFENEMNKNINKFSNYLNLFNINLNYPINFFENLIINLICLINEKNKIIILDSVDIFLKLKKEQLIKNLLNEIRKNNFVFIVRKECDE